MRLVALLACALGLASLAYGSGKAPQVMRAATTPQPPSQPTSASSRLTSQDKLGILRSVDGEFAQVVRSLPSVKPGFLLKPDGEINQKELDTALIRSVPAANPGDRVQITGIEFRSKSIIVNINGGSHPHESWRDRIHLSLSSGWPTTSVSSNAPPGVMKLGSTLIVDFNGPVPSITADQLKQYLSPFLSFAGERSASQVWVNTLPPKFRDAIEHREAAVGMNREMVISAMGRPEHKVREFQEDGTETEDWIYGSPPGKTVFVTFIGDQVVRVEQFP